MFHMRRFRTVAVAATVLGATALALAACSGPASSSSSSTQTSANSAGGMSALVAAAKKEGTVTIYSGFTSTAMQPIFAAFQAAYGIKGESVELTTAPMEQRFLTEAAAGSPGADILFGPPPTFYQEDSKYFLPINATVVPAVATWPKSAIGADYIEWLQTPMVLAYSTKLPSTDVPSTWAELANSKWAGQVTLSDPRVSANYLGWAEAMETALGSSYLQSLGKLNPTVVSSGAAGAQLIAAGSKELNFPTFPGLVQPLISTNAPVAYKPLQDPTLYNSFDAGIARNAPDPAAARLFMDWLMTPTALKLVCKVNPTAVPIDPTGQLGCIALGTSAKAISYNVSPSQKTTLLNALGL
jgi:iron(III) transport system substrate-binding protein